MLPDTLHHTHYWPWDGHEQRAVCGARMRDDATRHSLLPSCPDCQAYLTAEDDAVDAAVEATTPPLDAAEANAIAPPPAVDTYLFIADRLRSYFPHEDRLLVRRRRGGRR